MVNDLLTELERLHHRQADLRARERHLADDGQNDPASDTWKIAAMVAATAEREFECALVDAWPALAAFLREAVSGWGFAATFVQIGWRDHDGEQRFQGIIEFPDGPPELPALAVWNAWPFHFKAAPASIEGPSPLPTPPSPAGVPDAE